MGSVYETYRTYETYRAYETCRTYETRLRAAGGLMKKSRSAPTA
jgi:hypothetical protein